VPDETWDEGHGPLRIKHHRARRKACHRDGSGVWISPDRLCAVGAMH
jgi:hypothetical protein